MPITSPVGPTRRAARRQSMPPPDPRSTTRSPGCRSAYRIGFPTPRAILTVSSGSPASSRRIVEALGDPPVGGADRGVRLPDAGPDRVLLEEVGPHHVPGRGGPSPVRPAIADRSQKQLDPVAELVRHRRAARRRDQARAGSRENSSSPQQRLHVVRCASTPRSGGARAQRSRKGHIRRTASRQSIMTHRSQSPGGGGPRTPRVPAQAASGRGGAATGSCRGGPQGWRPLPCS